MAHASRICSFPIVNSTYNSHIIKTNIFLRTLCAFSILVQFTSFKLSTLGVRHPRCIPSDCLLFDEKFAQPCKFAVVNCTDVALSVFYSPVSTKPVGRIEVLGAKCVFSKARLLFLLYILIKNFLVITNFWGVQTFGEHCPPTPHHSYGPDFNVLPDIFAIMNCSVLGDR